MGQKKITFDIFVRGILGLFLVAGIVMLFNRLSGVLFPFFLAWLIAYLLFPLVKFFQYRCRMKFRVLAVICTFIVVGTVLWGFFMLFFPPIIEEALRVKDLLIAYLQSNETVSNIPRLIHQYIHDNIDASQITKLVTHDGFIEGMKTALPTVWEVVAQSFALASSVFTLTMVALYTLFILLDYETISNGWQSLLPERFRLFAVQLANDVEDGMNKYFRGQACVAFCVGVLFSIGFLIIGFPMAVGLGMFIGLLNMVPYLQLVGFIPTILLAIVKAADTGQDFWLILLSALIVFAVVQTIQDAFLTPKIMGKFTGLNSAIILLSLSIWGSLLGILGMVIALPMTTLIIAYYQKYVIHNEQVPPPTGEA